MAVPTTSADFFDLLRQSQAADDDRLKQAVDRMRAAGDLPRTATELADALQAAGVITAFQKQLLLQGKFRGFKLGKYRILNLLGAGGMGKVYLAEHVVMRRQVAIKVLPVSQAADGSALARFQREARAVAALNHRNIVQAYDIDQEANLHFLVMEYVPGLSLQVYVHRHGPIAWPNAADFIRQACEGLQHAADAGLIHRDIKPGNLLIDPNGTVKLLDLGLAMFHEAEHSDQLTLQHNENVLGTADYLSPEQALDSHKVDIRTDIYSLGCTFYYLVTGQPPFPLATVAQKLMAHQRKMPQSLRERIPDFPQQLEAVIFRAMAKSPDHRPATPMELSAALAPFARPLTKPFDGDPQSSRSAKPRAALPSSRTPASPTQSIERVAKSADSTPTVVPPKPKRSTVEPRPAAAATTAVAESNPLPATEEQADFLRAVAEPTGSAPTHVPTNTTKDVRRRPATVSPFTASRVVPAVVGVAAAAILGVYLFVLNRTSNQSEVQRKPVAPKPVQVNTRLDVPDGAIQVRYPLEWKGPRKLLDGIQEAGPGRTVALVRNPSGADWDTEPLTVTGKNDVRIMGSTPNTVLKSDTPAEPVFRITASKNLVVEQLILDGSGGPGPIVVVLGDSVEGVTFRNVVFRNYIGEAVRLEGARGTPAAPILFDRVKFERPVGQPGRAVAVNPAMDSTRNVVLQSCQFLGGEFGVDVAGPLQSIAVKECIFAQGGTGFRFAPGAAAATLLDAKIERCTFWSLLEAVRFDDAPGPGAAMTVSENLFVDVQLPPLLLAAAGGPLPKVEGNFATASTKAAGPKHKAPMTGVTVGSAAFVSTNAADRKDFLRPKANPAFEAASPARKHPGAVSPAP